MSNRLSAAGRVALDYAFAFPGTPSRTLAIQLHALEPELFPSVEHARLHIRRARKERGEKDRISRERSGTTAPCTKYEAAASLAPPFTPYQLETAGYGCIIGDVHIPYHDKGALETAINHAIKRNATDYLLINGDLMDCYQESQYERDPRKRHLAGEVEDTQKFLEQMMRIFGKVIYKGGNHERRHLSYILRNAPALAGLKGVSFPEILTLRDLGVDWVSWDDPIYAGEHLTIIHGQEYGRGTNSPVNAARGIFLKALACTIISHYHRPSHHDETDIRGRCIDTWSIGCLCGLHPEFARLNKWSHGFALFETDGADDWNLEPHRIVQGRVR